MSNLEPIEEKDLDLERKFSQTNLRPEKEPAQLKRETAWEKSAAETDDAYERILSQVKEAPAIKYSHQEVQADAQAVFEKTNAENQVKHLVDIAFAKGVVHAVKVARHLEDNYVLDMFHARMLSDDLHQALLEQGLIKEG